MSEIPENQNGTESDIEKSVVENNPSVIENPPPQEENSEKREPLKESESVEGDENDDDDSDEEDDIFEPPPQIVRVLEDRTPRPLKDDELDFFRAVVSENYEKVLEMLNEDDHYVNVVEPRSWQTPLHKACFFNRGMEIVDLLVENESELDVVDLIGQTPLQKAALSGNIDVVQYLIAHGARWKESYLLHHATRGGQERMMRYLLSLGLDINATDLYGNTALHYAAEKGKASIVLLLLSLDAKVDVMNFESCVPLMLPKDNNIKKLFILFKQHPIVKDFVLEKNLELERLSGLLDGMGAEEKVGLLDELEKVQKEKEGLEQDLRLLKELREHVRQGETISDFWKRQYDGKVFYKEAIEEIIKGKEKRVERQRKEMASIEGNIVNLKKSLEEQQIVMQQECDKEVANVQNEVEEQIAGLKKEIEGIECGLVERFEEQMKVLGDSVKRLYEEKAEIEGQIGGKEQELNDAYIEINTEKEMKAKDNEEKRRRIEELKTFLESAQNIDQRLEETTQKLAEKEGALEDLTNQYEEEIQAISIVNEEERLELEERLSELEMEAEEYKELEDGGVFEDSQI